MIAHNVHPSIRENGLANGCPRCHEHAGMPFLGLDDGNMRDLIVRIEARIPPRSTNEAIAMARVKDAMATATVLWERGWRPQ